MSDRSFKLNRFRAALLAALAMLATSAWAQEELREDRQIKKHKEVTQAMSEPVYRRLGAVHELLGANDYQKALTDLEKLARVPMNRHDESLVQQTFGFIYIQLDRPQDALVAFEKSLEIGMLPGSVIQGLRYSLAGLYAAEGQYQKSIDTMRLWFEYEEDPKAEAYMMIASAYAELEKLENALPYVRKAISKAEKPNENWYMLELAIHIEANRYREGADVLRRMLAIWPERPRLWDMLASINLELGNDREALDVMMVAYNSGYLNEESKILPVVQLNMLLDIPHVAGSILESELANGTVEETKKNLDMLLSAWIDAREYDKAVVVIDKLGEMTGDGKYFMQKASIHNEQGDWEGAASAARQAIDAGVEDPTDAYMLAGTAYTEMDRYQDALDAFRRAKESGDSKERANADSWIAFVEEKIQLRTALRQ
jgi:tetratricopeptide (TPR) repeat protein